MAEQQYYDQLKHCDLNLLVSLSVLLKLGHVSKAAKELDMSQSAVSQLLKRLRVMFDDPLLVKSHQGMTLTNKANAIKKLLVPLLHSAMAIIENNEFDPQVADGVIRLIMNDTTAQLCIAPLLKRIHAVAPHLTIEYVTQRNNAFQQLRRGQVDFVVGFYDNIPTSLNSNTVARTRWQMVSLSKDAETLLHSPNGNAVKLMRYHYQEHNHLVDVLNQWDATHINYALTSCSLSSMIQSLRTGKTATLLPHYAMLTLDDIQTEEINWLGEPIELPLKICWNKDNHTSKLHQWFKKELITILTSIPTVEAIQ